MPDDHSGELKVWGIGMMFRLDFVKGDGKPARPGKHGSFRGNQLSPHVIATKDPGRFELSLKITDELTGAASANLLLFAKNGQVAGGYEGNGSTDMPGEYSGEWSVVDND